MAKKMREPLSLSIDESKFEFVSTLGEGSFGSVCLMKDRNSILYAKKTSSLDNLMNLEKELRIMKLFRNHPRIVQASSSDVHIGINPERCFIFMEYASKATLHNMISEFRGRPMPENTIGHVALMILQGLEALHSHGYVHCDLKPANVLVFPSKAVGERWDLKLADFGSAKEPNTDHTLLCSTLQYMSPESFWEIPPIDPELDIWSLGCVVYEMFGGKYVPDVYEDSCEWRLFEAISPLAKDFLKRCHGLHPSRTMNGRINYPLRATATELLNHPFITQRLPDSLSI